MGEGGFQRVQVLSRGNGAGLSRDLALVTGVLREAGCAVTVTERSHRAGPATRLGRFARRSLAYVGSQLTGHRRPPYDINLMLERIYPECFRQARHNVLIPNPEWLRPQWWRYLASFDLVLAKTRHAEPLFQPFGCPVQWVGFSSPDHLDTAVPRRNTFLHMPGRSNNKGTRQLLDLWMRHPEWPPLTLVWRSRNAHATPLPPNVHLIDTFQDEHSLRRLQNRHRFHLCPSRTEGYGHYIAEAMGVGAVVITTDAEPMNELVNAERGVLVPARADGTQALATLYDFDDTAMEAAITRCMHMDEAEAGALGARARDWFERNAEAFPARLLTSLRRTVCGRSVADTTLPAQGDAVAAPPVPADRRSGS